MRVLAPTGIADKHRSRERFSTYDKAVAGEEVPRTSGDTLSDPTAFESILLADCSVPNDSIESADCEK